VDKLGRIFCLIGKSNAGKDTIFKELLKDKNLDLQPIVPYTTRDIRQDEQDGLEYHFIDEIKLHNFINAGKIIEQRDYYTINGIWSYCTIDDGQIDLKSTKSYLLIATLEAFQNLKRYFGESNIVALYIDLDDGVRLERALHREKQQHFSNYEELCRRFLADSKDFSIENLRACKIQKHFLNDDLEKCINKIKDYIYTILD